ncbi:MAG: PilZ domain-containing protein [Erythrobacter sp.]
MAGQRKPINASIVEDARDSARRVVRITAKIASNSGAKRARIHDLSETGLKLEIPGGDYLVGILIVDLPYVGLVEARIVWNDASFYGVEFVQPISKAAVSASLLRSRPIPPTQGSKAAISELPLGDDPSLEQITALVVELEENKGVTGNRLLGFRRSPDGGIKALVLKSD